MGNIMLSGRGNIVNMDWIYGTPKLRILRASLCLIWTPAKMNVWPAIRDMMVMLRAPGHVRGCHSVTVNTPETCASCQRHEKANTQTRMGISDICHHQRSERIMLPLTSPQWRAETNQRLSPLCVNIIALSSSSHWDNASAVCSDPSNDLFWNPFYLCCQK